MPFTRSLVLLLFFGTLASATTPPKERIYKILRHDKNVGLTLLEVGRSRMMEPTDLKCCFDEETRVRPNPLSDLHRFLSKRESVTHREFNGEVLTRIQKHVERKLHPDQANVVQDMTEKSGLLLELLSFDERIIDLEKILADQDEKGELLEPVFAMSVTDPLSEQALRVTPDQTINQSLVEIGRAYLALSETEQALLPAVLGYLGVKAAQSKP